MNNLFSIFRIALNVFCLLVITLNSAFSADAATKKTIHIGIYAPFADDSAYIGRHMLGAMEIARDQLKSSKINYEFYTLDKLADQKKAANVLQKFIEVHHINVLVTAGSESGVVVAPLAKKNDLIHFCLTDNDLIADGRNNFLTQNMNHKPGKALTSTMKPEFIAQFKQGYFSHPVTEAGYAYDIFHLLNHSAVLAMKSKANFSTQALASNLLALESGSGVMGAFSLNKKGIAYNKAVMTA